MRQLLRHEVPPLEYNQAQAPVPRWMRFTHIPFETLTRIPPDQYVQMFHDARQHAGRHWLPATCFGGLALLGFALTLAVHMGWVVLISLAFPAYAATHRAIMQSYLEGRLTQDQ